MNASCVSLVKYIPPTNFSKLDIININFTIELHHRYGFWTLPGGKQEPNETLEECQTRELYEETNLVTYKRQLIYYGHTATGKVLSQDKDRIVYLYKVVAIGNIQYESPDRPYAWLLPKQIMQWSGFAEYYHRALQWPLHNEVVP
jgi:8-oxo-dGTP pyrophosphatase MutT (NUDIX family)